MIADLEKLCFVTKAQGEKLFNLHDTHAAYCQIMSKYILQDIFNYAYKIALLMRM